MPEALQCRKKKRSYTVGARISHRTSLTFIINTINIFLYTSFSVCECDFLSYFIALIVYIVDNTIQTFEKCPEPESIYSFVKFAQYMRCNI